VIISNECPDQGYGNGFVPKQCLAGQGIEMKHKSGKTPDGSNCKIKTKYSVDLFFNR
jgi:hypothetical protein